jgi:hypothetical protein
MCNRDMSSDEREAVQEFALYVWEHIQSEKEFLGLPSAFDKITNIDFLKLCVRTSSCFPVNRGIHECTRTTQAFADNFTTIGRDRNRDIDTDTD